MSAPEPIPYQPPAERQDAHAKLAMIPFQEDAEPLLDDSWLIEDVIPDEGLGVAYGAPGSGKTFLTLDMSLAIAGATETWRSKYVEQGSVLYFGMEGGRMFRNRMAAYMREKGRAPHFHRSGVTLDLRSTEDHAKAVIAESERLRVEGRPPVKLIVVDTLARAIAGGNENAPEDMGRFVALCETIRKAAGCFLLIVHHSGKDEARGMRGHTALLGAIDTELHLEKGNGGRVMTVTKQRDGEDGERFGYRLRRVVLGISPRGKEIASCVVDDADVAPPAPRLGEKQGGDGSAEAVRDGSRPAVPRRYRLAGTGLPADRRTRRPYAVPHGQNDQREGGR